MQPNQNIRNLFLIGILSETMNDIIPSGLTKVAHHRQYGVFTSINRDFVLLEGDEPYESWTAYSRWSGEVYDNFWLYGEPAKKLNINTEITVILELDNCYAVEVDGELGYMEVDQLSQYRYATGGGSSSSGSSGGGGSSSGSSGEEWTPPIL